MKVIIPYREISERCLFKNTRLFTDKSLLEVAVEKFDKNDVFLACCPSNSAIDRAEKIGVERIDLSDHTLTGDVTNLVLDLVKDISNEELICFLFCTNPVYHLFNNLKEAINTAETIVKNNQAGSAMTVYPFKHYMLDDKMQGVNHGQGHWHRYSQNLPQWYINPWVFIVTTVQSVKKFGYFYTPDVRPIIATGPCIDIDTEDDFVLSQRMYNNMVAK